MNSRPNTRIGFVGLFALSLLFAGNALANDPAAKQEAAKKESAKKESAKNESAQPVTDTWITTKVKADLLATKDVSGTEIKVDTKNGVVKLEGTVATQAEVDRAIANARAIDGVKKVDSSQLKVAGNAAN